MVPRFFDHIPYSGRILAGRYRGEIGMESTPLPTPLDLEDVVATDPGPIFVTMVNPPSKRVSSSSPVSPRNPDAGNRRSPYSPSNRALRPAWSRKQGAGEAGDYFLLPQPAEPRQAPGTGAGGSEADPNVRVSGDFPSLRKDLEQRQDIHLQQLNHQLQEFAGSGAQMMRDSEVSTCAAMRA
ncbi:MAG: hypothetical protein ABIZ80_23455 [Bryobacteraceae bacterium]